MLGKFVLGLSIDPCVFLGILWTCNVKRYWSRDLKSRGIDTCTLSLQRTSIGQKVCAWHAESDVPQHWTTR